MKTKSSILKLVSHALSVSPLSSDQTNWQAIIAAHPLESHEAHEWLRYGTALLMTLTPGPDQHRLQQQAALAFVQARREGAEPDAVHAAQQHSTLLNLIDALRLAGLNVPDSCSDKVARLISAAK